MENINGLVIGDDVLEKLGEMMSPERLFKSSRNDIWEDFVSGHPLPNGYKWKVIPDLSKIIGIAKQSNPNAVTMVKKILLRYDIEKYVFGKEVKLPFLKCQKKIITCENRKKAAHYYRCLKNAASVPAFQILPKDA